VVEEDRQCHYWHREMYIVAFLIVAWGRSALDQVTPRSVERSHATYKYSFAPWSVQPTKPGTVISIDGLESVEPTRYCPGLQHSTGMRHAEPQSVCNLSEGSFNAGRIGPALRVSRTTTTS